MVGQPREMIEVSCATPQLSSTRRPAVRRVTSPVSDQRMTRLHDTDTACCLCHLMMCERARVRQEDEERARMRRRTGGDAEPIAQGMSGVTRAPLQRVARSSNEVARSSNEVARSSNEVARSSSEVAQGSGQVTFIPLAPILQPQQVAQGVAQGSAQPIVITGGQLQQYYATSYMSWRDEENARRTHAQQLQLQLAQQLAAERATFPDIPRGQRSQLAEQPLAQPAIGECCIRHARWGRNGSFTRSTDARIARPDTADRNHASAARRSSTARASADVRGPGERDVLPRVLGCIQSGPASDEDRGPKKEGRRRLLQQRKLRVLSTDARWPLLWPKSGARIRKMRELSVSNSRRRRTGTRGDNKRARKTRRARGVYATACA
jgi:hypothetical protein